MANKVREASKRHIQQLADSRRVFNRLRPELKTGWWVTRAPGLWVRTGSPRDELLTQTRIDYGQTSDWTLRRIMGGVLRLVTMRARKVTANGDDSGAARRWQALLHSGEGDCLLFDWSSGAVARESSTWRFTEDYFNLRERMGRHVAVPELLAALPPSRQIERLVQGRSVLSMSASQQIHAAQCILDSFASLAESEVLDVPPSATLSTALKSLHDAGGASAFQLKRIEPAIERLKVASRSWVVVPSHGDACLYNTILVGSGYFLIDTAKCGPRYEWHDSVHLMMFSGSTAVKNAVLRGEIASRVAGRCSSVRSVSPTQGTPFEDLVLAFVLVGSHEAAREHPFDPTVFARSLRWHLSQPGVHDVIARIA